MSVPAAILRRAGALALLLAWAFAPAPAAAAPNRFAAPGRDRPNFLLLLSDDQTWRTLGLLGECEVRTPNLDRLARRGTLFTHCFNQGGWSGAVCIPSRAMLNTGRTLWQSRGASNSPVATDVPLWGETLRGAGYDTFMAGKWHLTDATLRRSFATLGPLTGGFRESTPTSGAAYFRPAPGNPWTPDDPRWGGHWIATNGTARHSSEVIADAAVAYLLGRDARAANPFFMYVAFNAPHDPRQSPARFPALYPPSRLRLPPNWLPQHPFLIENDLAGRDEILAPYPRTPDIIRTHLREYYAIITHLDEQVGRILDALEATGAAANTVVVFTSDQGLAVGQHGLMGKQNLYEHSVRMPLVVAGPGIARGRRDGALVYMQSLFATTCDLAGIPVPPTVQFRSLAPLLAGTARSGEDAVYGAFLDRQRSVRTDRWKLIRTPKEGRVQLFDLAADPWERTNLAGDPRHAATVASLDARLRALMAEFHDPLPPESVPGAPR